MKCKANESLLTLPFSIYYLSENFNNLDNTIMFIEKMELVRLVNYG